MLLKRGADINATNLTGRTPLMFAVECCNDLCVKFLANYEDNELDATDADGQTGVCVCVCVLVPLSHPH